MPQKSLLASCAAALTLWPAAAFASSATSSAPAWMVQIEDALGSEGFALAKSLVLGILLFLAGWFVAKLVSWAVYRLLCRTSLDNKIASKLGLDVLFEQKRKSGDAHAFERTVAKIVYVLLMLLVVVGVLDFAGLSQAAGPIQTVVDTVAAAIPLIGKAILILAVAYIAALVLKKLVSGVIGAAKLDARFAQLSETEESTSTPFSETAGRVVFWLVMFFGLAGAADALRIEPLSTPLQGVIAALMSALPSIAIAALLLGGGWILGRIARAVIANLLAAVGFDGLVAKVKLDKVFGERKASDFVGLLVMVFIMVEAGIAALDELGLVALSEPLTGMISQFWLILPILAVSALIVAIGVLVGRIVRGLVSGALRNIGFDSLAAKLGLERVAARQDELGKPSEIVGFVVQLGIILVAVAQALSNLELVTWAGYVDALLEFSIQHLLVALVIIAVGLAIGNYVRDMVAARQGEASTQWMPELARYGVLVFAVTMAVNQLGVAEDFVLLSFGLLFGALCLDLALAFGLGSRDVAGDIVKRRYQQLRSGPGLATPRPAPAAAPREASKDDSLG